MNNGPEHINEHAIYLNEACKQLQAVDRGRHNQVPWNVVQQYLDSTIVLVGKVLRQPALREILQQVKDAAKCTQNIQHDVAIIKNSVGLSTAPLNTSNFSRKAGATWAHVAAHAKGSMPIPPPAPQDTLASETQSSVTAYKDQIVTVKLKNKGVSERHRAQSAAWTKHRVETSVQANTATRAVKIVGSKDVVLADLFQKPGISRYDILAIQEPWRNPFIDTTYHPLKSQFHLLYLADPMTRVCLFINKRIDPST